MDRDLGIFAQDKWTTGRWTLSGGIRYDHFKNSFPEQTLEPSFFTPNRSVSFPRIDNISWHDITPKLAATYDLFGNGKTALKTTLNKYLLGYGTFAFGENGLSSDPNPIFRLVNNATRTWVDADHDFVPDCNLQNFAENGECGALDNPNFGTIIPGTSYDPDLLEGWGKRQFNWEFSARRSARADAACIYGCLLFPAVVWKLPDDGRPICEPGRLRYVLIQGARG